MTQATGPQTHPVQPPSSMDQPASTELAQLQRELLAHICDIDTESQQIDLAPRFEPALFKQA